MERCLAEHRLLMLLMHIFMLMLLMLMLLMLLACRTSTKGGIGTGRSLFLCVKSLA